MNNSTFTNNQALGRGGAIDSNGSATISGSAFTGNASSNGGGGIFNGGQATITGRPSR